METKKAQQRFTEEFKIEAGGLKDAADVVTLPTKRSAA